MHWWQRRRKREHDLERELRSDLEMEAAEQQENGLSAEEAGYAARRAFGNPILIKEQVRWVWSWRWLDELRRDVYFALRTFARTPGFTAVIIATLSLGIGAISAMFSVVNTVFLHPLPYPNANRLVVVWEKLSRDPKGPPIFDSYRDFQEWHNESRSFEQLAPATWATAAQILTGNGGAAREVLAMPVGIDFFRLLGAKPALGRLFEPEDLKRGCIVALKHRFWITAFGGRKDVVGRHIELGKKACTIVGITPPAFTFYPDAISMWTLITPDSEIARDPENANVGVFGLLRPGIAIGSAQKELQALYVNRHRNDSQGARRVPVVYSLAEQFAYLTGPNLRLSIVVLSAAVSFVLLIACINIANLLLGRSIIRQKELAVRAALGSGRARLIRQLLTEGLVLSFMGAFGGILLALCAVHYFRVLNPIQMPPGNPVTVNLFVMVFVVVLSVGTALAFGLVPALKASRIDLIDSLKASGRAASLAPGARTFGKALVIAEVTLTLALLAGAGLLIQSVNRLASVPLGFSTSHVLTVSVNLPEWSYSKPNQRAKFYRDVLDRAAILPGVELSAFASFLPLSGGRWRAKLLTVEGRPEPTAITAMPEVGQASVTPEYFQAMDVPLVAGRPFKQGDQDGSEAVAIVNRALAQKYFPRQSSIGKHIKVGQPGTARPWLTIIGIAGDERDSDFFHEMTWNDIPLVFRPVAQDPPGSGSLVLRTSHDKLAVGAAIHRLVAASDSTVPVGEVETMEGRLSKLLAYPRFRAAVVGAFAGLALLLSAVGLYGVLSQLTAQRLQEFGLRMALGAQKSDVLRLVIRQGLSLTSAGLAIGLTVTLGLNRLLSGLLYGVEPADPWTLIGISVLLVLVSLLATYLPARRAAGIDPVIALRYE